MIRRVNTVSEVCLVLYGNPISKLITPQQENGRYENLQIPLNYEYNGSFEITHACSQCQKNISYKLENKEWINCNITDYINSKDYKTNFTKSFKNLLNSTATTILEGYIYIQRNLDLIFNFL